VAPMILKDEYATFIVDQYLPELNEATQNVYVSLDEKVSIL
jgi:hypothetical protein